jgi:hypothetical protein
VHSLPLCFYSEAHPTLSFLRTERASTTMLFSSRSPPLQTHSINWLLLFAFQALLWNEAQADVFIVSPFSLTIDSRRMPLILTTSFAPLFIPQQDHQNNTVEVLNDYELNFGLPVPDDGVWVI